MTQSLLLTSSRAVPVSPETAYDRVLPTPLPTIFRRRYGVIPPVRRTEGPEAWGIPGQTRTVVLADGGRVTEELLTTDRPRRFTYRLSDVHGAMRPLASEIEGAWSFDPVGTGTRIAWTWAVRPASRAAALALPAFGRVWRGYARQALEEVERLLLG
ncbi:MAG: SRPBCC family protein [Nocardioidaceae bacterium]